MIYTAAGIQAMDRIYRLNLINSFPGLKPVNMVGTISSAGLSNLSIISSVVHIGSDPPLIGFMMRPAHIPRHTYKNVKETAEFSINMVTEKFVEQAHLTSGKYPENVSEFEACGFTEAYLDGFVAPVVSESPVKAILSLEEELHLKSNGSILIIGKIQHLIIADGLLQDDGNIKIEESSAIAVSGLGTYYGSRKIVDYPYVGSKVNNI